MNTHKLTFDAAIAQGIENLYSSTKNCPINIRKIGWSHDADSKGVQLEIEGNHHRTARVVERYTHKAGYPQYRIGVSSTNDSTIIYLPMTNGLWTAIQGACAYLRRQ